MPSANLVLKGRHADHQVVGQFPRPYHNVHNRDVHDVIVNNFLQHDYYDNHNNDDIKLVQHDEHDLNNDHEHDHDTAVPLVAGLQWRPVQRQCCV